jgi:hypothetical protein
MREAGRLFVCARCRTQVVLCSRCDRGNVYCGRACSQVARRTSMHEAGRRYQASRAGRFAHAERARRYRARHKNVTHQGSAIAGPDDLLPAVTTPARPAPRSDIEPGASSTTRDTQVPRCSRCGASRAQAVRQGWLRRRRSRIPGARAGPLWRHDDLC